VFWLFWTNGAHRALVCRVFHHRSEELAIELHVQLCNPSAVKVLKCSSWDKICDFDSRVPGNSRGRKDDQKMLVIRMYTNNNVDRYNPTIGCSLRVGRLLRISHTSNEAVIGPSQSVATISDRMSSYSSASDSSAFSSLMPALLLAESFPYLAIRALALDLNWGVCWWALRDQSSSSILTSTANFMWPPDRSSHWNTSFRKSS
jgi:hypothetical protein